jgi:hypothetical protein
MILTPAQLTSTPIKAPNDFLEWLKDDNNNDLISDEYARYISQPQVPGIKQGYKWWLEPIQQKNYPNLSKMALDILSIPTMLADPKHLFSSAKIIISNHWNRLGIYTLEALECLKSWLKISTFLDNNEEDDRGLDNNIRGEEGILRGGSGQLGSIEISD